MKIGLDRLRLNNIKLKSVNVLKIKAFGEIVLNTNNVGYKVIDQRTGEVIYLEELILNITGAGCSNDSKAMQIQLNKNGGTDNWNISIGVNISKLLYGTNKLNLSDIKEIEAIPRVIDRFCREYGLEVDLDKTTVSYLEVNYNVYNKEFYKTMAIINEAWKYNDNKVFVADTKDGIESLKLKLPTREIKVYNKVKQLQDMGYICTDNDITRIEVSTSHVTTIKNVLGGNKLTDLIDNYPKLVMFYKNTVTDNVYKPFKKYCDDNVELIYDLLQEGIKPRNVLDIVGLNKVVDLDVYKQAIINYYKDNGKKNPYRMIKNNIDRVKGKENYIGNKEKMEEFMKEIEKD